jgi:hypothetical protein
MNYQEFLFEQFSEEAERSFAFADTLDLRANIWLVIITFLAAQSAYFIGKGIPHAWLLAQYASAALMIMAGIATMVELYPRTYLRFSPSNGALERRLTFLRGYYEGLANADELALAQLLIDEIGWARERTTHNNRHNNSKTWLLQWAFWLAVCAFVINLLTLLGFFL